MALPPVNIGPVVNMLYGSIALVIAASGLFLALVKGYNVKKEPARAICGAFLTLGFVVVCFLALKTS